MATVDEEADAPDDKDELIAFIDDITKGGGRAMVDLADLARKHYFHPSTKGSSSIKKVLPAVMSSSAFLKRAYSQPTYGTSEGITSHNFEGVAWWQQSADGEVVGPYQPLVSQIGALDDLAVQAEAISQGGAASYAYLKLQFENLDNGERESLRAGLLRYCELDTLAMVFNLKRGRRCRDVWGHLRIKPYC